MSSDVRGLSQQWMAYSAASFGTPCPQLAGRAPCGAGRAPCGVAGPLWGWQGPVGWQSTLWGWQGPLWGQQGPLWGWQSPCGVAGPRTYRRRWTSTLGSRGSGAGCGTGRLSTSSPALHPMFPQGDLWCPRKCTQHGETQVWKCTLPSDPLFGKIPFCCPSQD